MATVRVGALALLVVLGFQLASSAGAGEPLVPAQNIKKNGKSGTLIDNFVAATAKGGSYTFSIKWTTAIAHVNWVYDVNSNYRCAPVPLPKASPVGHAFYTPVAGPPYQVNYSCACTGTGVAVPVYLRSWDGVVNSGVVSQFVTDTIPAAQTKCPK